MIARLHRELTRLRAHYLAPTDPGQARGFGSVGPPTLRSVVNDEPALRDGSLLFQPHGQQLEVLDLGAASPAALAQLPLEGQGGSEVPVARAGSWLLLASPTRRELRGPRRPPAPPGGIYDVADACSLGYNCRFGSSIDAVTLSLVDLTDPLQPRRQRTLTVPGTRLVTLAGDDSLLVGVFSSFNAGFSFPELGGLVTGPFDGSDPAQRASLDEALERARVEVEARILATDVSGLLPWIEEDGVQRPACGDLYRPESVDSLGSLLLLSLPLSSGRPLGVSAVLSSGSLLLPAPGGFTLARHQGPMNEGGCLPLPFPREQRFTELYGFHASDGGVSPRWSGRVPAFVMGDAAVRERGGVVDVLSSYASGGSVLSSLPLVPGPPGRLAVHAGLSPWAAHFEPQGRRLLAATSRGDLAAGETTALLLLDLDRPAAGAVVSEAATDARRVRWLGADHALALERSGDRVLLRVRDLGAGLPVRDELVVSDAPARRWIETADGAAGDVARFVPVPGGVLAALSLATPASCDGVPVEREAIALYHASDDGRLTPRGTVPLPGDPCALPSLVNGSNVRRLSLDDGELSVATDRALVRLPLDAGASPSVVELP